MAKATHSKQQFDGLQKQVTGLEEGLQEVRGDLQDVQGRLDQHKDMIRSLVAN